MVDFDDLMPDDEIMAEVGNDVVFLPSGGSSYPIKAVVEYDVERVGSDGYTLEHRTEVEFLLSAISTTPRRGDRIKHKNQTYVLEGEVTNDGKYSRWAVR